MGVDIDTTTELHKKLLTRYIDPYKVLGRLGELIYEVVPVGRRRRPRSKVVHVVRLKPFHTR